MFGLSSLSLVHKYLALKVPSLHVWVLMIDVLTTTLRRISFFRKGWWKFWELNCKVFWKCFQWKCLNLTRQRFFRTSLHHREANSVLEKYWGVYASETPVTPAIISRQDFLIKTQNVYAIYFASLSNSNRMLQKQLQLLSLTCTSFCVLLFLDILNDIAFENAIRKYFDN